VSAEVTVRVDDLRLLVEAADVELGRSPQDDEDRGHQARLGYAVDRAIYTLSKPTLTQDEVLEVFNRPNRGAGTTLSAAVAFSIATGRLYCHAADLAAGAEHLLGRPVDLTDEKTPALLREALAADVAREQSAPSIDRTSRG
jgi:hypothetical protein